MQPASSPNTLDNPAVRAELDKRKASKLKPTRRHAVALELLLTHCSWREFGYRLGRWERVEQEDFIVFRQIGWALTSLIQLIDLRSGHPVGELYLDRRLPSRAPELPRPSGRVWVAGSPLSTAALTLHGPELSITQGSAAHLLTADPEHVAQLLVSGQEPLPPTPYRPMDRYGRSTWLADCPTKPRKQDGFTWRYTDTDRDPWHSVEAKSEWRTIGK